MSSQLAPMFDANGNPVDYADPNALLKDVLNLATESTGFQKTMNLDEVAEEWLLITDVQGPFRIPSNYSADSDGKTNVLVIECQRNLDPSLAGVVEYIPVSQMILYNYFSNPRVRAYFDAGGELGCKFSTSRTKTGMKLWTFEVCSPTALNDKLLASLRSE